jgi:uncharacterized protein
MAVLPETVSIAWEDREGPVFDDMKTWNPTRHPGRAAVAIHVEEVYSGAKRLA